MAFEVTTIQQVHQHMIELSGAITKQADAFAPELATLTASRTAESQAVLSLQAFSMALAQHVIQVDQALIRWMADEATLRDLDAKDGPRDQ